MKIDILHNNLPSQVNLVGGNLMHPLQVLSTSVLKSQSIFLAKLKITYQSNSIFSSIFHNHLNFSCLYPVSNHTFRKVHNFNITKKFHKHVAKLLNMEYKTHFTRIFITTFAIEHITHTVISPTIGSENTKYIWAKGNNGKKKKSQDAMSLPEQVI